MASHQQRFFLALLLGSFSLAGLAREKELIEKPHAVKQGETVADVARDFYGNKHYDVLILKHNNIKDRKAVVAGTALKVPDLADVLVSEGIKAEMMDDVNAIVKARYTYMRTSGDLMKALAGSGKVKSATIPVIVRDNLTVAADAIEAAAKSLAKKGKFGDSPTRMKNRLIEAASAMRKLAKGTNDPKLDDGIHLLIAQAWVRAIMWVRNEDGDG